MRLLNYLLAIFTQNFSFSINYFTNILKTIFFQNIHLVHGFRMQHLKWFQMKEIHLIYCSMAMNTKKRPVLQPLQIGCVFAKRIHRRKNVRPDAAHDRMNNAFD